METRLLTLFAGLIFLAGCSTPAPEIRTLCLRDDVGNYLIKWETDPALEGTVKIYVSDNPNSFAESNPVIYANIKDGIATYITRDNIVRSYFRLTFNDKYPQVVGSRLLLFDNIRNFRDMGGYTTTDGKQIRWGKVFRSGDFYHLGEKDSIRLQQLGIKTIIDLRGMDEAEANPIHYPGAAILSIPIPMSDINHLPALLREGRMRKRDALLYMQDQYLRFVNDYSSEFAQALVLFKDEKNYPILFNCTFGKDRTGFLSAMLMAALDVPEDQIISDFTLSSEYVDVNRVDTLARSLSQEGQEAVTVLLSSSESLITPTLQKIKKDYGSMHTYLSTALSLTDKDREKMKDILLY